MARNPARTGHIVKLKVTLQRVSPPVWRRLLVPANVTMRDLHRIIQTAMGWSDGHLHEFTIDGGRFGDPATTDEVENETRLTLVSVRNSGVARFSYTYDFGDDWEHQIVVEGTAPRVKGQHYPACIAGKRACPPEDCGGPFGYANLLQARADPTHPDHAEISGWLGEDFDPEAFSPEAVSASLAAQFGRAAPRAIG